MAININERMQERIIPQLSAEIKLKGLNQQVVADYLGVSRVHLNGVLNCTRPASIELVASLAAYLDYCILFDVFKKNDADKVKPDQCHLF